MSNLGAKLAELTVPKKKPNGFAVWYSSLNEEDQKLVWASLTNPLLKSYAIFPILREEGLRVGKDTFKVVRDDILAGKLLEENLHV